MIFIKGGVQPTRADPPPPKQRQTLWLRGRPQDSGIEKEPEDEGYFAYSPTLPGCFSNGKTIGEAKRSIREAIELHLASLMAHTQPIPQNDRLVHVEELTVGVPE